MSKEPLYWHCLQCGAHDPVAPKDSQKYAVGDPEPCIGCRSGTARVVTLKVGAMFEQGIALGLSTDDAWLRAFDRYQSENKHAT